MSVLAVIPARGGSKRLPGKNMKLLGDTPLVGWSILHAVALFPRYIDEIIVSSDDEEILGYARQFAHVTALKRPDEFATDKADSYCVIKHAVSMAERSHQFVCLLQPTSPLRLPRDVVACIGMAETCAGPAAVSYEDGKAVPNGAVYVGRTDWLLDGGNFDSKYLARYFMPAQRSIDIDTAEDFAQAVKVLVKVVGGPLAECGS